MTDRRGSDSVDQFTDIHSSFANVHIILLHVLACKLCGLCIQPTR